VALPTAAAIGIENGHLQRNDHVAMLGIGSGINVLMLGLDWQTSPVDHGVPAPHARSRTAAAER
jgi:3-oxoacyl-[acyl-carrier-protein] synthase-3